MHCWAQSLLLSIMVVKLSMMVDSLLKQGTSWMETLWVSFMLRRFWGISIEKIIILLYVWKLISI